MTDGEDDKELDDKEQPEDQDRRGANERSVGGLPRTDYRSNRRGHR